MDEDDYKLYVLAELCYKKEHKDINEEELFPNDWYSSKNYKLKTEIIAEALNSNKKVEEVDKYLNLQEGVKERISQK